MDIYEKIIDPKNIEDAYLFIVRKFEEEARSHRYAGLDGKNLAALDTIFYTNDFLKDIRQELIDQVKSDPLISVELPKKNKEGMREVHMCTLKERIKGQAVHHIIEPIIDPLLSERLYSYRSSHPTYRATESFAKKYRKCHKDHFVIVGDIKNYFGNINKAVLKEKIKRIGFDQKTENILGNFIDADFIRNGKLIKGDVGILQGHPVLCTFANFYLADFDKEMQKISDFYLRVGDDFLLVSDSVEKLESLLEKVKFELSKNGIKEEFQTLSLMPLKEKFDFLGYAFENGKISIRDASIKRIKWRWKKSLAYRPDGRKRKIYKLKKIMYGQRSAEHDFIGIVNHYYQMNDEKQIKMLSEYFFRRLTIYFFGKYSSRNHQKTKKLTRDLNITSLIKYYKDFRNGRATPEELRFRLKRKCKILKIK